MNRGCLVLAGLGLLSLLAFGVTLETINDSEQLTAIPFTPWDFLTYSILALATLALIRRVRKRNPRKALVRKWTSRLAQQGACIRTSLCLASDWTALIDTTVSKGAESRKFSIQARWQLLDNKTLYLWGTQTATWKILTLHSWTMITADQAGAGFPVRWTTRPRINAKPWLLVLRPYCFRCWSRYLSRVPNPHTRSPMIPNTYFLIPPVTVIGEPVEEHMTISRVATCFDDVLKLLAIRGSRECDAMA